MAQQILERLQAIPVAAWILLVLSAVIGYGAGPIVRRIRRIPEGKQELAMLTLKSIALVALVVGVLLAMQLI